MQEHPNGQLVHPFNDPRVMAGQVCSRRVIGLSPAVYSRFQGAGVSVAYLSVHAQLHATKYQMVKLIGCFGSQPILRQGSPWNAAIRKEFKCVDATYSFCTFLCQKITYSSLAPSVLVVLVHFFAGNNRHVKK